MTETVLRLRAHEVWSALEVIDPVAVLAEDLIGRTGDRSAHPHRAAGRLVPWPGSGRADSARGTGSGTGSGTDPARDAGGDLVKLDHPGATPPCVLPAHSLRASLAGTLAAVAARELLPSGGVTVAMVGSARTTEPQLSVIARNVPDISHVALCLARGGPATVEPKLADELELSGIGLVVVTALADAVFGANLVIATNHGDTHEDLDTLRLGQLARGSVLVNATGKDLPADLVDQVDQVFVDDLGLLAEHRDRHVVAAHLAGPPAGQADTTEGTVPRITADLRQLLIGQHDGLPRPDHVVLVELLGAHELNAELAYRIYEGATRTGLGEWIAA